jgi:branched-chain amino acid transport system substrate-binding protein
MYFLNKKALTKIRTATLLVIIIIIATVGGVTYMFWSGSEQTGDVIKIGLCADINMPLGKAAIQGLTLAAEQINAEGGILGRQVEVIGEDSDSEEHYDLSKMTAAFNRLLTYHKVDFVIGGGGEGVLIETAADHRIIMFGTAMSDDAYTQMVQENYDRYKYFFRTIQNTTIRGTDFVKSILYLRELTGFNKIAYIATDYGPSAEATYDELRNSLENFGFEYVYDDRFIIGTVDFSSYLGAAEAAGAEILVTGIMTQEGIPLIKEWYDRQSPMIVCGRNYIGSGNLQSWEWTEGKCENVLGAPFYGYPLTTKTQQTEEAYFERWGTEISPPGIFNYDTLRFILCEAIKRAGTTETEAVLEALEMTSVETSFFKTFTFTTNHDSMYSPDDDTIIFQWQEGGTRVPIYPPEAGQELGASYTYPDWPGPWD